MTELFREFLRLLPQNSGCSLHFFFLAHSRLPDMINAIEQFAHSSISIGARPATAKTGLPKFSCEPRYAGRVFPSSVCRSRLPSPVITRSKFSIFDSSPAASATTSKPGRIFAPQKLIKPNPSRRPRLRPVRRDNQRRILLTITSASLASARSKISILSSVAPFWGPKTRVAPFPQATDSAHQRLQ